MVSMETDDYDMDSEEVPAVHSQLLPGDTNEEGQPLPQRSDSGYASAPSSLPLSEESQESQPALPPPSSPGQSHDLMCGGRSHSLMNMPLQIRYIISPLHNCE